MPFNLKNRDLLTLRDYKTPQRSLFTEVDLPT